MTSTSNSKYSINIKLNAPRHKLNRSPAVGGKNFSFDIKQALVDSKNKKKLHNNTSKVVHPEKNFPLPNQIRGI
jgi:hypothetical protein